MKFIARIGQSLLSACYTVKIAPQALIHSRAYEKALGRSESWVAKDPLAYFGPQAKEQGKVFVGRPYGQFQATLVTEDYSGQPVSEADLKMGEALLAARKRGPRYSSSLPLENAQPSIFPVTVTEDYAGQPVSEADRKMGEALLAAKKRGPRYNTSLLPLRSTQLNGLSAGATEDYAGQPVSEADLKMGEALLAARKRGPRYSSSLPLENAQQQKSWLRRLLGN